ncbi:DUF5683 domain-containing protein [soil metagenome]
MNHFIARLYQFSGKALLTAILLSSNSAYCQTPSDSTQVKVDTVSASIVKVEKPVHSVRKATLLSTFIPGAGQVYNHKIWKVPILYAGFIGVGSIIKFNNDYYQKFNKALILRLDGDSTTVDAYSGKYSDSQLAQLSDNYHRNRDLSIVIFTLIYVLNIIDAHVDAHLFSFNVSDDLSMQVRPTLIQNNYSAFALPATGINISLSFR